MPDLHARPIAPQILSALVGRKPYLLRPLAAQVLPPPLVFDPAEHLGIDLRAVRNAADARQVLSTVWAALSRGDIAAVEGARIARQVRRRLRALRRLARLARKAAALGARLRDGRAEKRSAFRRPQAPRSVPRTDDLAAPRWLRARQPAEP